MAKLRIIVTTNEYGAAGNVGGPAEITVKTFDVDCPAALADFLRLPAHTSYTSRWMSGVELIAAGEDRDDEHQ